MALKKSNTAPATPAEEVQVTIPTEAEMTPGAAPVEEETPAAEEVTTQPETAPETPTVEPGEAEEEQEEPAPAPEPDPEPEAPAPSVLERMMSNKPTTSGVHVDTSVLEPDPENIPEEPKKNVKIRLREDHRCTIAMRQYIFEKGHCYDVPPNVKEILNKRGLLLPL